MKQKKELLTKIYLYSWIRDNKQKMDEENKTLPEEDKVKKNPAWADALKFIQFSKNQRKHKVIGKSPYEVLFGQKAEIGTQCLNLDDEMLEGVIYEDDLLKRIGSNINEEEEESWKQYKECENIEITNSFQDAPTINSENNNSLLENHINVNDLELNDYQFILEDNQRAIDDFQNILDDQTALDNHNPGENDGLTPLQNVVIGLDNLGNDGLTLHNAASVDCISCSQPVHPEEVNKCVKCSLSCHPNCISENGLCIICKNQESIKLIRADAHKGMKKAGLKMKKVSAAKLKEAQVNDSVLIPVPPVDRGRLEALNVFAIVIAVDNGVYKLGTRTGVLDQSYTRNQFSPCIQKFLDISEVPLNKKVALRTVAKAESEGNGQGMLKCFCTGKCLTKACTCKKHNQQCNSRCHNSGPCSNK